MHELVLIYAVMGLTLGVLIGLLAIFRKWLTQREAMVNGPLLAAAAAEKTESEAPAAPAPRRLASAGGA